MCSIDSRVTSPELPQTYVRIMGFQDQDFPGPKNFVVQKNQDIFSNDIPILAGDLSNICCCGRTPCRSERSYLMFFGRKRQDFFRITLQLMGNT